MSGYRLFLVEPDGHIRRPPIILECESDEEAVEAVKDHDQSFEMELWIGHRKVASWPNRRSLDNKL